MEYNIEPTDVETKLGIDDLKPNELDIAYMRGYEEGRLSAKDLYEALRILLVWSKAFAPDDPANNKAEKAIVKAEGKQTEKETI